MTARMLNGEAGLLKSMSWLSLTVAVLQNAGKLSLMETSKLLFVQSVLSKHTLTDTLCSRGTCPAEAALLISYWMCFQEKAQDRNHKH